MASTNEWIEGQMFMAATARWRAAQDAVERAEDLRGTMHEDPHELKRLRTVARQYRRELDSLKKLCQPRLF